MAQADRRRRAKKARWRALWERTCNEFYEALDHLVVHFFGLVQLAGGAAVFVSIDLGERWLQTHGITLAGHEKWAVWILQFLGSGSLVATGAMKTYGEVRLYWSEQRKRFQGRGGR